ncbi:MAG: Uma2 family endonuclease [Phormidesmis sp.]
MTYTLKRYQTYQDYLDAEELSPEGNYRLLSTGEVIEVPTENDINRLIVSALMAAIIKAKGLAFFRYLCPGNKEIQVHPSQDKCVNRKPDLMVLDPTHLAEAKQAVLLGMNAPAFVAEVVSPGSESSENYLRDYVWKRKQYERWQIPEYWIIDPHQKQVTVLTLVDGKYRDTVYVGRTALRSSVFPAIELVADDLVVGQINDD